MKEIKFVYIIEGFHEETQKWMSPSRRVGVTKIHTNKKLAIRRAEKDARSILFNTQNLIAGNKVSVNRHGFSGFRVCEAPVDVFKPIFVV